MPSRYRYGPSRTAARARWKQFWRCVQSAGVRRVRRRRAIGFLDCRLAIDGSGKCSDGRDRHRLFRQLANPDDAAGSLVTIALHVLGTAASARPTALTLVNQVNPSGQRVFTTTVADDKGAFVLHWNNGQCIAGGEQQVLGIGQHIVSGGGQQAAGGRWQAVDDVLVDADNDAPGRSICSSIRAAQ